MTKTIKASLALLLAGALLLTGCAPPAEYARLATAGRLYYAALDNLLIVSRDLRIDSTSEVILAGDLPSHTPEEALDRYDDLSKVDNERIEIIDQLRAHVRLMDRYFLTLHELATSDAPDRFAQSVDGIVGGLDGLGNQIRGSTFIGENGRQKIGALTAFVIGGAIRGKLKDELDKRKETIRKELATQEVLLEKLAEDITQTLKENIQARERRKIHDPLTATEKVKNPDDWVKERRAILTAQSSIAELSKASGAVKRFREAFENLVNGNLTLERVNDVIADFDSILTLAETLKRS